MQNICYTELIWVHVWTSPVPHLFYDVRSMWEPTQCERVWPPHGEMEVTCWRREGGLPLLGMLICLLVSFNFPPLTVQGLLPSYTVSEFPGKAIWLLEIKCVLSLLKKPHQLQIFVKSLRWTTNGWPHLFRELWWLELTSVVMSTFWKTRSIMEELFLFHFESMKDRYL